MKHYTLNKGFTLVELLVGLVLTALFIGSVIPVAVNMRDNFNAQHNLSNMMEDGRYTVEILSKEIRRAGYLRNRLIMPANNVFLSASNNDLFGAGLGRLSSMAVGEFVKGDDANSNSFSDKFIIRYQLHDQLEFPPIGFANSPCTEEIELNIAGGEDPAIQRHVVSIFYFIANEANNVPTLFCRARRDNLEANSFDISNPMPVISNVEGMRVLYGWQDADTDNDGDHDDDDGIATIAYLDADQMAALPNINFINADGSTTVKTPWQYVANLRVSLILQSENQSVSQAPVTTISLNGNRSHTTRASAEGRLYRVFSTTAALRNYL